ncbi:hypothetical protein DRQ36_06545 [bacterium]|nr:MAG: hypothetical protein DRQ36_06545 [bacterium]
MVRIALLSLALISVLFGTTYWVHSTNGDDAWSGTSPDSAFATLGAATTAMGQNDQCHACGTFTETLTFSDNDDEGCRFSEWPDSAYWTIDGEATRECIYIEANCGYWNETYPGIHNCKAVNSISPCVELGIHASLIMTACSISVPSVDSAITSEDYCILLIDSSYIESSSYGLYQNDYSGTRVSNSTFNSATPVVLFDECVLLSHRNIYNCTGDGDGLLVTGMSTLLCDEDVFSSSGTTKFIHSRYGIYIRLTKCRIVGNKANANEYAIYADTPGSLMDIVNCTIDSCCHGLRGKHTAIRIMNTVLSRCDTAIAKTGNISVIALDISECATDTSDIYGGPISYWTFDPELDGNKVAQADSAKLVGVNIFGELEAPLWDDLGHWFRNSDGTPAIGWRSPYSDTGWPESGCQETTIHWGIRSPARRLK